LAAGLPPLLAACGGDDDAPAPAPEPAPPLPPNSVQRTYFFDLSKENHKGKTYLFEVSGRSHKLVPMAEKPEVLAQERLNNAFLSAVPDASITHHVEGVVVPQAVISLGVVVSVGDGGTWSMSSIQMLLPEAAAPTAFARAVNRYGSLPTSVKRKRYGVSAAATASDLHAETALLETASFGATLMSLHPDTLGIDGTAASHVYHTHISSSEGLSDLTDALTEMGPAVIGTAPADQAPPWATLKPMIGPDGATLRTVTGPDASRIMCKPVIDPDLGQTLVSVIGQVKPGVKDDVTLGKDVTAAPPAEDARGALWVRHDGKPALVQPPINVSPTPTPAPLSTGNNFKATGVYDYNAAGLVTSVTTDTDSTGATTVTFHCTNLFCRYLGQFVEFYDAAGNLLPLAQLDGWGDSSLFVSPPAQASGDSRVFVQVIQSVSTIFGVPIPASIFAGSGDFTIKLPSQASTIRVYAGGLGTGSNNHPEAIAAGVALTCFGNFALTTLFALIGAADAIDSLPGQLVAIANEAVNAIADLVIDDVKDHGFLTVDFMEDFGETLVTAIGSFLVGKIVEAIVTRLCSAILPTIAEATAQAAAEKATGIAGIVMSIMSLALGAADIAISVGEIIASPFTYINDIKLTKDLTVQLLPDTNDTAFPRAANQAILTASFDGGKGITQNLNLQATPNGYTSLPPLIFTDAPAGGMVTISVAFVQTSDPTATYGAVPAILLGKGTIGPVANDGTTHIITITEYPFPVDSTTSYQHQKMTMLDPSGQHVWVLGSAPSGNVNNLICGGPGVCETRDITVRQGTSGANPTISAVGYSWYGQNNAGGPVACVGGGGAGAMDQIAVLNIDAPGAGGYAASTCGSGVAGMRTAFSLTGHPTRNYYIDTSSGANIVRRIGLDPSPSIDGNTSNNAFGVFNFASDAVALHPSGYLVSVCRRRHVFEVLSLSDTPTTDAQAQETAIAQIVGGVGTRPGLINLPTFAAITPDGVLLILEAGNNRIQAFDLGGNPAQYFDQQPVPYYIELPDTPRSDGWTHLDMKVEFTGLLYVLSYLPSTFEYRLNIYHPKQTKAEAITHTSGVYADKFALDLWRNLYTLNYGSIQYRDNPAQNPALVEPSLSLWVPCSTTTTCPV